MANFFFDGTANVTAAKSDVVLITANPALFTSQAQVGGNVVFSYSNGTTLTVTGTTLGDSATTLPGVSLASGQFATGATANGTTAAGSQLFFGGGATQGLSSGNFAATSVHTAVGGNGVSDPNDTADTFAVGGKGSFLIYGNAGSDTVTQTTTDATFAFDSTSFVTVFGGKNGALGNDTITLANTDNANFKAAIYGGEGTDVISVVNTGANAVTTIFGGQGAADSTDGADSISFNGGGAVNIFGNAGADQIELGITTPLNATTQTVSVHGGLDGDLINIKAAGGAVKATIIAYGDEGIDTIRVGGNGGTTVIYGDTAAADANGGNDTISYSGQGTATIYAAGGNDTVIVNTTGANLQADGTAQNASNGATALGANTNANPNSTTTVFLGNGDDDVRVLNQAVATGTTTITGGAGVDTFRFGNNVTTAANNADANLGSGLTTTITDFTLNTDLIVVNNGSASTAKVTVATPANATLQTALDAAANSTSSAANPAVPGGVAGAIGVVAFGGDTYVVVSDGTTGYSNTGDYAIKLTGVNDAAGVAAAITII